MQELYQQLQIYFNMDEEISYKEFSDFYKKVVDQLGERHETFEEEDVWKALFIVESIMSNADSRSKETKGTESKKYKKMAERSQLWSKNFSARLHKLGYADEQINERFEQMFEEGTVKAE